MLHRNQTQFVDCFELEWFLELNPSCRVNPSRLWLFMPFGGNLHARMHKHPVNRMKLTSGNQVWAGWCTPGMVRSQTRNARKPSMYIASAYGKCMPGFLELLLSTMQCVYVSVLSKSLLT